jgi:aryl-alcohol dehydrogenase-like predicted oxidoreductase
VHPVADLQIEYSLVSRSIEDAILPAARELGIAITAYGVLSRGLLTGALPALLNDARGRMPRFQGENYRRNLELTKALAAVARRRGVTPSQLAIAWVLARGQDIVPLIGTTKRQRLTEAIEALSLRLTPQESAEIEAAVPPEAVSGTRYAPEQMAHLDSERR